MDKLLISQVEKLFIVKGIEANIRNDGRKCDDYRQMELECGILTHANGSAAIRIGDTSIIASVKAEMGIPLQHRKTEGRVDLNVECSSTATPSFEGRSGDEIADSLKATLESSFTNDSLDLSALCLLPGKHCWVLFVDILLVESGGNFLDAASIAMKAALMNTKLPTVSVIHDEGHIELDLGQGQVKSFGKLDVTKLPVFVTLHKVDQVHVVDATREEEACSMARLAMGVRPNGSVTSLIKEGGGGLQPESLFEMMQSGKQLGIQLNKSIEEAVRVEWELKNVY